MFFDIVSKYYRVMFMLKDLSILALLIYSAHVNAAFTELEVENTQVSKVLAENLKEYRFQNFNNFRDIWIEFPQFLFSSNELENRIREIEVLLLY